MYAAGPDPGNCPTFAGDTVELFIARQPIFDAETAICGYELLYRRAEHDTRAEAGDPSRMSSDVIVQSFLEIGLEHLTGGKRGYVNFGRQMLLERMYEVLSPDAVVIELLEDVVADEEVVRACEELVSRGYVLALDDYVSGGSQDCLLSIASIVKVDLLGRTPEAILALAAPLQPHGATLLAERVETEEAYRAARAAGFQRFQGYYFSRPETVAHPGKSIEALRILPLMNAILDDRVTDTGIEDQFRRDPLLSHKLLQIVSSASFGGRGIDSILHAIRMVGRSALHRWLALLLTSSLASGSGASWELVQGTLVRARLLELVAKEVGANMGALFLIGVFSNMDSLLQLPMAELLGRVDLAPEVRDSLLREASGPYVRWLELAEAYESGDWEAATRLAGEISVRPVLLLDFYVQAVQWAGETLERQEAA